MSLLLGMIESDGLIFEGRNHYGAHLVWPTPVMTPAQFVDSSAKEFVNRYVGSRPSYCFREDMFDSVSRVRRGRFYKATGAIGNKWCVLPVPHVSLPRNNVDQDGMISVSGVADYNSCSVYNVLNEMSIANAVVILGKEKSSTLWSIIHVETGITGEELVTLKARQSLGALPIVALESLPPLKAKSIQEALQTLEDDYHLASPESVVDRANEAATRILNAYLSVKDGKTQDSLHKAIGAVGNLAAEAKKEVARNAADIVRLLHGRTKYAVQAAKKAREVREQDAELAVQCIGVMLCDLEWAEWR